MDTDMLKSPPEDQINMLMMMQMDKLSDLSGDSGNNIIPEIPLPPAEIPQQNNTSTDKKSAVQQNIEYSPTFINRSSDKIFFAGYPSGEEPVKHHSPSNLKSGAWKNREESPSQEQKQNSVVAMRESIFRIAAMQPIYIDPESVKPPKRRNVKISKDPQSVAARHRRERISEKIRILQRLVPGGTKMDTASMLDEATHYIKFLQNQLQTLERVATNRPVPGIGFPLPMSSGSFLSMQQAPKNYQSSVARNVQQFSDA